jgi:hypothetical protein
MLITLNELMEMDFEQTHEWLRDSSIIKANEVSISRLAKSKKPMVYAWVSPLDETGNKFKLLYIGKAGGGVAKRLREHEGGFKNSGAGRKNYALLMEALTSDRPVQIYGRISENVEILGQTISMYSAEEEALCDRFSPEWNRAQFAKGSKKTRKNPGGKASPVKAQKPDLKNIDFSGLARSEEVLDLVDSIIPAEKRQLAELLAWCFEIEEKYGLVQKIVNGYTNQPSGCSGVPMLLFANFGKAGMAKKDSWKIRVPLQRSVSQGVTVVLPSAYMANGLSEHLIARGKEGNFRPVHLEDFLKSPSKYVTL